MQYVIGVDTGGTFTDLICVDETGHSVVIKRSSTPANPSLAVIESLEKAAAQLDMDFKSFLSQVERICHGTTVSTNTVLTWTGAKVGMLCTKGFRDILEIRFGIRENPYDYTIPPPKPLAPRYLRLPIEERVNWKGDEITPLNEGQVRDACKTFKTHEVEAVVVAFLWSFKNPVHERKAVEICKQELPGVYVIGSCDIQPEIREYWRMSTAVLSGYVGPNLSHYVQHLVNTLEENGFGGELLITQSNAGVMFPEIAIEQAVRTILSGPACAPAAAAYVAGALGMENLITTDMGGTSFDVCLIKDGQPWSTLETAVGGVYHLRLPLIDVHTIGAGGGSIAWVDKFNVLHVGPQSAGADPGPACYGRGGTEATSTDADLVLGYLNPEYFLGGEMKVDLELSRKAIKEQVADRLEIDVLEAAKAIRTIIDHGMSDAISKVSVERGEDPRKYTMVAAGGAGPVHVANLARSLGINQILIPRNSSVFCAIGSVIADIRHDLVTSILVKTNEADLRALNKPFDDLQTTGDGYLARERIAPNEKYYLKSIDMRYKGQFHEVNLSIPEGKLDKESIEKIIEEFHRKHEDLYGYRDDQETEMINLRLAACGKVVAPSRKTSEVSSQDASPYIKGERDVYFQEKNGFVPTKIYDGNLLEAGNVLEGPAIVEQRMTTVVVPPGARFEVTKYRDFLMTLV
jgi:N-methylhydantoinase A